MSKRQRDVDANENFLDRYVNHDVWGVIEANFTVVDMLVLCSVSCDVRRFAKERMRDLSDFLFCALVPCKPCGSRSYSHICGFSPGACLKDISCVKLASGENGQIGTFRVLSMPIESISLCHIDEEYRMVTIGGRMKESIQYNWGRSHTIMDNFFCLIVHLDDQEGSEFPSEVFYSADDALHLANGIFSPTLFRKAEIVDDRFLFDRLCYV